jgi:hypothetical protein
MTTSLTDMSQDPIEKLDLEPIIIKLTAAVDSGGYNWPESLAKDVVTEYRIYLKSMRDALSAVDNFKAPQINSPNKVVGIFWLTHILFTQKYFKDSEFIFGQYLHRILVLPDILIDEDADNASSA